MNIILLHDNTPDNLSLPGVAFALCISMHTGGLGMKTIHGNAIWGICVCIIHGWNSDRRRGSDGRCGFESIFFAKLVHLGDNLYHIIVSPFSRRLFEPKSMPHQLALLRHILPASSNKGQLGEEISWLRGHTHPILHWKKYWFVQGHHISPNAPFSIKIT